jgi:hypothetical protein
MKVTIRLRDGDSTPVDLPPDASYINQDHGILISLDNGRIRIFYPWGVIRSITQVDT